MPVADVTADVQSLDLGRFGLDPGQYTVYVKAVGKPSLTNKMSPGRRIRIAPSNPGPSVALNVTPSTGPAPSHSNCASDFRQRAVASAENRY